MAGVMDFEKLGLFYLGQRYDAAGLAQGAEFRVNTYTTSTQWNSSIAMDGSGNFVVPYRLDYRWYFYYIYPIHKLNQ